uniref:Uncharacterized protein n=1 Tax=Arundo donax TaxID=35708 RepID=A0A0A9C9U1_ARUDO
MERHTECWSRWLANWVADWLVTKTTASHWRYRPQCKVRPDERHKPTQ